AGSRSSIGAFLCRIGYRSPPGRSATERTFPRKPGRGRASGMHRYPTPGLLSADLGQRARARWLEVYADTRMGEVFIWRLFNQVTINPFLWGEPTDQEIPRSRRSCQRRDISSAMSRSPASPSPFSFVTPPS